MVHTGLPRSTSAPSPRTDNTKKETHCRAHVVPRHIRLAIIMRKKKRRRGRERPEDIYQPTLPWLHTAGAHRGSTIYYTSLLAVGACPPGRKVVTCDEDLSCVRERVHQGGPETAADW
eukprot:TRINITY_DN2098_c0_g1_i1.p3 TRINITY_DN2098_c0_g1~~TRINITY_DN2098_c0_g1_i1.p3  ORF type:complete len:118 (-),score=2.03 TRINITY_DN2098_c0_g1_i1:1226-1579(-)